MTDTLNRHRSRALVDKMLERNSTLKRGEAEIAVARVFDAVKAATDADQDILISGFGKFKRSFREGREARNPATGETVTIAGKHILKFKQSSKAS